MPPLEPRDHRIGLEQARAMIQEHRKQGAPKLPEAMAFHRDVVDSILNQPGCVALRMYPARHADGNTTMVLVGVDKAGQDMTSGVIAEESLPCPPWCADASALVR